ncbi:MAG: class I SAM-dependent methyltransferase [Solirubrobacterales bacterium]
MLAASLERISSALAQDALVLDVGGGANPVSRADWVLDIMPYADRGLYGDFDAATERFDASTWVIRDMCDHEPWPFADDQFDFAVCSHTLEDIRDPVWVCRELIRVARAGYVEVPSRLEEQSYGLCGEFVGWPHHRWLVDVVGDRVGFVVKPAILPIDERYFFPEGFVDGLESEERVQRLFWEGGFEYRERIFTKPGDFSDYLSGFVAAEMAKRGIARPRQPFRRAFRWLRKRTRFRV